MEKMEMQSRNIVGSNVEKIMQLFPQCVTERKNESGELEFAVDFEKLQLELSDEIIGDGEERYQFTWPEKKKAIREANVRTTATLRPCREESVDFDNTGNLYIEGDNLEVLKVLRETYLGKVKMIYIDPPYNTGSDFVYNDKRKEELATFEGHNGLFDDDGNMLLQEYERNTESDGRFHTKWLNMMYPRLKVARDLLTEDGVIFISIDDNEKENLNKICDEIFGENNFVASFAWRKRTAKTDVPFGISQDCEWIICYAKSKQFLAAVDGKERKYYETPDFPDRPWRIHDMSTQRTAIERPNSDFTIINPKNGDEYPVNPQAVWRITKEGFPQYLQEHRIVFPGDYDFLNISKPVLRYWKEDDLIKSGNNFGKKAVSTYLPENVGKTLDGTREITEIFEGKLFSFPKPTSLICFFVSILSEDDAIILDFFSGSATTAHAVMKLNAEDGGKRKFIMVQLPEKTDEKSEAYKAGYKNICEIGKERIRRAGLKIKEEAGLQGQNLDTGFRVLKLASSNMEDVYYTPETFDSSKLFIDNVKADRTPEDLLFQVMLELGVELSAKIESRLVAGKEVHFVDDNYLIACFDADINEAAITEIAKMHPVYFVMRDSSMSSDNVADNFDQIFQHYSKDTVRRIL
ncbi:MAG: site-specific DNA-methyltransferase [Candidatus Cryptobacteroides sp.]